MIRSAIVPVAGLGTRLLPATKSQPKEMLPVARKPVVRYVAEELVANGIEQILFITGRNKNSIEDHFDAGAAPGAAAEELNARFFYTRQGQQRGLGDAILCGENFAGDQPFVAALGDAILGVHGQSRMISRMVEVFEEQRTSCVVAIEEIPPELSSHYGIVEVADAREDHFRVLNVVEKPRPEEAPSRFAVAGRYIFSPVVFDLIRRVNPDAGGQIQITDAIRLMCEEGKRVRAVRLPPGTRRYDIGDFPSYFAAFMEFALADPAHGSELRSELRRLLAEGD
jgi:UTP--glucose-1-phosphate uridylyltransferase